MLSKRIIPCLDVRKGYVVKGIQFKNHVIVGDIISLAKKYAMEGADELVFYDIHASVTNSTVDKKWILKVAKVIDIPFCVAGGIKSVKDVQTILSFGADKISINSPALDCPDLIYKIADKFGSQCVVVGIDSWFDQINNQYYVYQYTGSEKTIKRTRWNTINWVKKVQDLGVGEIVLNMINQDGIRKGYDLVQLKKIKKFCNVPLIASGGAGVMNDFYKVFSIANVEGALAASVFHNKIFSIKQLKCFLVNRGIKIREC
ncbi:Imidazole glycerol phosphate synthase subunit HisF [Buchnera aphidicola (Pterocallis alni)]|uniref:imidazole glycerol phosphate synthase subunit HisF n=1 Tax=Buchnera aphidicola TaxID=9 RepID=UPI00346421F7